MRPHQRENAGARSQLPLAVLIKKILMKMLSWLSFMVAAALLYRTFQLIKNIFFHSLSHIPGPRLAAASRLYEWYYDCVLIGQYCFKIRDLHDEYGNEFSPSDVMPTNSERTYHTHRSK